MKTKDIFDFRRFRKYFVSDLKTCSANYGLSLLTISLLTPLALYVITVVFNLILHLGWEGPSLAFRSTVFGIAMFCMVVTMPVKCYGGLTDKQYGSFWLTLPASRLEKFLSMLIITCIVAPFAGIVLYLGLDALISTMDKTCGGSIGFGIMQLLDGMGDLNGAISDLKMNLGSEGIVIEDGTEKLFKQISSPWMYIDDMFCMILPFLLGAICFKKGKTVKTFLAMAVFSTALSIIATPIVLAMVNPYIAGIKAGMDVNEILNSGLVRNLSWIDTLSDTALNVALLVGIWFRIKTLKH